MAHEPVDPEDCPNPEIHGNPFRYCPACTWIEEPKPTVTKRCEGCGTTWTAPVLACPTCA